MELHKEKDRGDREGGGKAEGEPKPLSVVKTAFLLLRVKRVFKKKIQIKKEKNNFAPDVVFPKAAEIAMVKPPRKSRIPPLIRSRTVPAIIVPFSIIQAQLVKTAPSTANDPAAAPLFQSVYTKDVCGKSDYSTPGVDYIQFLTGNVGSPPSQSSSGAAAAAAAGSAGGSNSGGGAGTPPSSYSQQARHSVFPGYGHPSLASRDSVSSAGEPATASWNANSLLGASNACLSASDRSMSVSSGSSDILSINCPSVQITPSGGGGGGGGSSQSKAFGRFARLLNAPAEERRKSSAASLQHYHGTNAGGQKSVQAECPSQFQWTLGSELGSMASYATPRPQRRRRSLEAEDLSRPRAVSIDSLLKNPFPPSDNSSFKSFSVMKRLSTGSAQQARIDQNKYNQGFVTAVELGNVTKVKTILETADFDINNLSLDGLSLLDVAVIQRNGALTKLLLAHGATESRQYCKDSIGEHLDTMVAEAECKSEDLMARLLKCSTFGNLSSAQLKELEKDFHTWEKRYKKYRKMKTEYSQINAPDPPAKVTVDVISTTAVRIRFHEADNPDNSICTKYKIEWSLDEDFPVGTTTQWIEMFDLRKMESVLSDLTTGQRYYFRVSGGNCKGYGHFQNSTPASVIPSSWRDLDGKKSRYLGKSIIFDDIFGEIQRARPEYASELRSIDYRLREGGGGGKAGKSGGGSGSSEVGAIAGDLGGSNLNTMSALTSASQAQLSSTTNIQPTMTHHFPNSHAHESHESRRHSSLHGQHSATYAPPFHQTPHQKKNQKIISIKQLFASAPKFQKHFKRGIFLSCVMYSEDKLLVTNEEFLPTIEIDETFPSSLHNDFHWLLKVASTWEDVKSFRNDMEKSGSASTFHFRLKLLQASAAMQNALGVTDLGRLYYNTIRDKGNSVVVITTINYMRSTKMISSLNARWIPLTKINSRKSTDDVADVLINSIQEQILYHQVSNIPVGRGLYLGYLKLASSVDVLKIVVSEKTPNMLPHAKIRDNPHVSSEEWTLIQKLAKSKSLDSLNNQEVHANVNSNSNEESNNGSAEFSEAQELFRTQLNTAMKRLFSFLDIEYDSSLSHRMYNCEVIEVSNSVSLLVVFPSLENVCLVAGQSDKLLQRNDLIPLPVQVFEMIHLSTYQKDFITRYARLSAILEMDTILAQHNQREAFSSSEMATAKQRMTQLQDLQSRIDSVWKVSRWVIDVVTASRDKSTASASIRALTQFDKTSVKTTTSTESVMSADAALMPRKNDELQLGFHSKSEQHLPVNSGMKFSRSENQLSNFGGSGTSVGGGTGGGSGSGINSVVGQSSNNTNTHSRSHSHSHHPTGTPANAQPAHHAQQQMAAIDSSGFRKASMPPQHRDHSSGIHSNSVLHEKVQFKPQIYSTHSQSDSTISQSGSREDFKTNDGASSTSLHNLYRQQSSGQIIVPIPNLVVIDSETEGATPLKEIETPPAQPVPIAPTAPHPTPPPFGTHLRQQTKASSEPPPVPPRRTIPPPPPPPTAGFSNVPPGADFPANLDVRVFSAFDPPTSPSPLVHHHHHHHQPHSGQIPSVSVKMFDSISSGSGSSRSNADLTPTSNPSSSQLGAVSAAAAAAVPSSASAPSSPPTPSVVVIQVFAAYNCGLSEGTSVRLQITSQTTARQVVDLLVKQLNAEVKAKGLDTPYYERTQDFCLVSVIGARERCLRNDFKPLLLQSPWKRGRLYVRKKSEVTAAIDMNSKESTNF